MTFSKSFHIPLFWEVDLLIPLPENLPRLVWRENEEMIEPFTEIDYKNIQVKIQELQKKNDEIQEKIKTRDSYVVMMDEQEAKYKTFYQMFENNQERNQSYYKMFLSMVTMVLFLVIVVAIYYYR